MLKMSLKSVKEAEANVQELTVTIDAATFKAATVKVYNKQKKDIAIPGFRKGKVPMQMVERMYGKGVFYEDALNDLFPAAVDEAIKESGIEAASGAYDANVVEIGDNGVEFTVKVATQPDADVGEYKGLSAEKPAAEVTDEEVNHEIDHLREQNSRLVDVDDRAAKDGDMANINFEGFVDGVAFEGGKAEDYDLVLGSGAFIPGFEEQIVGKNIGEEFDVNVTFPTEYTPELAGKEAVFKCKLNKLSFKELPEVDDEFAKDLGEYDTIAQLKEGIKKELGEAKQRNADDAFENALREQLVENVKAEIPAIIIDEAAQQNKDSFIQRFESQGISYEQYLAYTGMDEKVLDEQIRAEAEKQVKLRLALEKIAKLENIEVTDEDVNAEYDKIATTYGLDLETVKKFAPAESVKADVAVQKAMKVVVD
ncbi:MAG: trigger factor, partial [Clostridia bacterium]|nr:trigger factor [Clostridia bacterium]